MSSYQRIACLSTEAVEVLYRLGVEERIAGISGYTVHPPRARREKPRISGFSSAKIDRILAVKPDLVIGFSDLQADIIRDLIAAGIEVHVFNHRTIEGIFAMITTLAALMDRRTEGAHLVRQLQSRLDAARERAARWSLRPRVYFEEWDEPAMCGIRWVSELIGWAGAQDVFAERAQAGHARERMVSSDEVIKAAPEIIIGSWCGKKFKAEAVAQRAGWQEIPAVRDLMLFEIKSPDILSPGPAALEKGLEQLGDIVETWQTRTR